MSVALVTGGSQGIGRSICEHLADGGYHVLNLSFGKTDWQDRRVTHYDVDLADAAATAEIVSELAGQYAVTNVVHNAGVIRAKLVEEVSQDDVEFLSRLHIGAAVQLVQGFLDAMKAAGFGRVVVISSRAMLGLETRTAYSATKAGQLGMVRTLAMELGQHGVTVNAIAPGPIVTPMFTDVVPEGSEQAERIAASLPVKRLGQPGDIARAVMFLLSPDNGFVTGQCLFVCGGASLGSLAL